VQLLCHVLLLSPPRTLPYSTHKPPITHPFNDMGYRWDIGGISKRQLRNNIKHVTESFQKGDNDQEKN